MTGSVVPSEHIFEQMKRYMRFGADDERTLRELLPRVAPHIGTIIDDFYARIEADEAAAAVIKGGSAQVTRLKHTLSVWVRELFTGPWDDAYFERRAQIGRRHVVIQMPQHLNFTAMNVIREHLVALCCAFNEDHSIAARHAASVNKVLDLELAIILHTYSEDYAAQLRRHERLATFGQLTSTIGHELRNPLSVIESSVYLLRRKIDDDPAALRHVEKIQAQVARSNRIITSMLDIVRDRAPTRIRFSPVQLAERAVSQVHDDQAFAVQLQIAADVPAVMVDPEQFHQVLCNLLSNAREAAGANGTVRLRVACFGDDVELLVSDDGPGIDPSVRGRLFEPLVTTKDSGVGLGLALCRKIVEAHGGVMELGPPDDLGGAVFAVRLRAARAASSSPPAG